MKEITSIISLLSLIISVHGSSLRIYKGTNAPIGAYPYHAYLRGIANIRGKIVTIHCGGSVLNQQWILTAAHCFEDVNYRRIKVYLGSVFRKEETSRIYSVRRQIIHEGYDQEMLLNDIALLRVTEDIEFDDNVKPIPLANQDTNIGDNETVVLTGFGDLSNIRLQAVHLKMYSYDKCKRKEPRMIETQICTFPDKGKGPCEGDSGGPLVNEHGIQVGINSHIYRTRPFCCGLIKSKLCGPAIYTRVSSYRDWIDRKIGV